MATSIETKFILILWVLMQKRECQRLCHQSFMLVLYKSEVFTVFFLVFFEEIKIIILQCTSHLYNNIKRNKNFLLNSRKINSIIAQFFEQLKLKTKFKKLRCYDSLICSFFYFYFLYFIHFICFSLLLSRVVVTSSYIDVFHLTILNN